MSYAKSWTDKFNDGWYLSLRLNERGVWDQLFTYAKLVGDTGHINVRSWSDFGTLLGCDARTCRKIVRSMHDACKLVLNEHAKFLEVEILNYDYYQRVKKVEPPESKAKMQQKCSLKQSRQDQSRQEQAGGINADNKNVDNSRKRKIVEPTGNPKLDSYRQWKLDNYQELVKLSEQYEKQGGTEWVKSHTQDIETDIIEKPDKYLQIGGQKWLNWVKGWLKRSAEQNQAGDCGMKEPMTAAQEKQHYEQHKDKAASKSNTGPKAIGDVIKKLTGE